METLKSIGEYDQYFKDLQKHNHSIGFVPTMGALHDGHLSLVERAKKENAKVICSIFVNPTQFNDPNDFNNYPRDIYTDLECLKTIDCDAVFIPSNDEMYPEENNSVQNHLIGSSHSVDLGHLATSMEAKYRAGHFDGVVAIVQRLFNIIRPDRSYFGEKDFQQLVVIKTMAKKLNYPTQIIGCPIIREEDGIAMSSRNQLLSKNARKDAPIIYKTLCTAAEKKTTLEITELKAWIREQIDAHPSLNTEYVEICNLNTLQPLETWDNNHHSICCLAVFADGIRLIDNMVLFN